MSGDTGGAGTGVTAAGHVSPATSTAVPTGTVHGPDGRAVARLPAGDALHAAVAVGGFVWFDLLQADASDVGDVASLLDLPDLAMRDALMGEARTRVEVHDGVAFIALQPARYVGHGDGVETADVGIFVGAAFVVTVQRGDTAVLDAVRAGTDPGQAVHGPFGLVYEVIARVVDGYGDVAAAIDEDLDDIERMVFGGSGGDHSERIYMRMRSVLLFRRAAASLVEPLERLADETPDVPAPVVPFVRHVHGHAVRVAERCEAHDRLLTAVLAAELAQVSLQQNRATAKQNEDVRRISAWAAIGLVPTAIAGVYGMNFEHMPELGWRYGYPVVVAVIVAVCLCLHRSFHRNGWL